jgi:hypothetical protein
MNTAMGQSLLQSMCRLLSRMKRIVEQSIERNRGKEASGMRIQAGESEAYAKRDIGEIEEERELAQACGGSFQRLSVLKPNINFYGRVTTSADGAAVLPNLRGPQRHMMEASTNHNASSVIGAKNQPMSIPRSVSILLPLHQILLSVPFYIVSRALKLRRSPLMLGTLIGMRTRRRLKGSVIAVRVGGWRLLSWGSPSAWSLGARDLWRSYHTQFPKKQYWNG